MILISLATVVLAWGFTACYWIVALPLYICTRVGSSDIWLQKVIRTWGKGVLKILNIQLVFLAPSTIEDRDPKVVICNHQSAPDVVIGAAICPPSPLVIGKKEVIFIPFLNVAWRVFKFIRVDRRNHELAIKALSGIAEKVWNEERTLLMAPEGTREPDGNLLEFKKGAFRIAIEGQLPIYPFVIEGAFRLLPKHAWLPKPGIVYLKFLAPVETKGLALDQMEGLILKIRADMASTIQEIRRNAKASSKQA